MNNIKKILKLAQKGEVSSIEEIQKQGYDLEQIFKDHTYERALLTMYLNSSRRKKMEETR